MVHQEKLDLLDLWRNELHQIWANSTSELSSISKLKLKRVAKEINELLEEENSGAE